MHANSKRRYVRDAIPPIPPHPPVENVAIAYWPCLLSCAYACMAMVAGVWEVIKSIQTEKALSFRLPKCCRTMHCLACKQHVARSMFRTWHTTPLSIAGVFSVLSSSSISFG